MQIKNLENGWYTITIRETGLSASFLYAKDAHEWYTLISLSLRGK